MIYVHPPQGSIIICDFTDFHEPEMTKRRPVIVVSKPIVARPNLCTVVPISCTPPNVELPLHYEITFDPPLPFPYNEPSGWIKGDMIYAVAFDRLFRFRGKRQKNQPRAYIDRQISPEQLICVKRCVLAGIGILKKIDLS